MTGNSDVRLPGAYYIAMPTPLSKESALKGGQRTLRAVIYARVSRDRQERRSIKEQLEASRRVCLQNGWAIVGEYSDDISASQYAKKEREDWRKVLAAIEGGRVDLLVVWEITRATRERMMWAVLIDACQQRNCFIVVDGSLYDPNDPDDMAFLDFMFFQGVREVGMTRKRINRTHRNLAKEGRPVGKPPYGYRHLYDESTGRLIARVINEDEAQHVREAADRVCRFGHTPGVIVADFNRRGITNRKGEPWKPRSLQTLLRSPAIAGKRVHRGEIIHVGGWEPIISWEQWLRLQRALDDMQARGGGRADSTVKYMLSGIAVCGVCGGKMKPGLNNRISSYKCGGLYRGAPKVGCVARKRDVLDEHVTMLLVARMSMPDLLDLYVDRADEERLAKLEAELEELRAELEEAYRLRREKRLSVRGLAEAEEDLLPRIAALEEETRPRVVEPLILELHHPDPEVVRRVWVSWDIQKKREALRRLTQSIRVLPVGKSGRRVLNPSDSVAIKWV